MTIITYTDEPHGFGLTYDDARLVCIDDPSDPRLAAAWSQRIGHEIAASVLLTVPGCTADEIAAGQAEHHAVDAVPVEGRGQWRRAPVQGFATAKVDRATR